MPADKPALPAPRIRFARTAIAAAALATLAVPAAFAQTAPAAPAAASAPVPSETIVIRGQAEQVDRALNDQGRADDIRSVVRSDGIGRLPDKNTADALQRLPGVSVDRDQGEGRYVSVRGLGPAMNAVTINGSLLPSPEDDTRAIMLDALPSGLVGSLEVIKTLTPDMDANSIGGTINIKSLSAFDSRKPVFQFELGGSHNGITNQYSPSAALTWADRFADGKLGIAVGLNAERRRFGSDNVEAGDSWDGDAFDTLERTSYDIVRERIGLAVNLEFRPNESSQYYLRSMLSRYADTENQHTQTIEFDDAVAEGNLIEADSERAHSVRTETQRIFSLVLGTEQKFGDWTLDASFGWGRASETTPEELEAVFEGGFDGVGWRNRRTPRLIGDAAINDPGEYELDGITIENGRSVDREHNFKLDLTKAFGDTASIKFGGKASRRTKTNDKGAYELEDFDEAPFSLADDQLSLAAYAGGAPHYQLGAYGPSIRLGGLSRIAHGVNLEDFVNEEDSRIEDYEIKENINAAYAMGTFSFGEGWKLIAGLRWEGTKQESRGTRLDIADGDETYSPTHFSNSYSNVLPGAHLRYDLGQGTSFRAAWTNSVVRPTFEQIAPFYSIEDDDGEIEAEFGNPKLKPLKSSNLDAGVEHRIGFASAVSAYAFYKRIKDFAYQTDLAGTGSYAGFDEATTFVNGDTARVYGIELSWQQSFRGILPGAWGGLFVGANATFSKSKATVSSADDGTILSRSTVLPYHSKSLFNVVLGYDQPQFGARVALNRKSAYLVEIGDPLDKEEDSYVDSQTQVDLSLRWSPTRSWAVTLEGLNLTDEPYYVYFGHKSRNAQWESYGRSWRVTLKYTLD